MPDGAAAREWPAEMRKNGGLLVALGLAQVLLGMFAIAAPLVAGIAVELLVGVLLTAGGICALVQVFQASSFGMGALALLIGGLSLAAGVSLILHPLAGLGGLTLLLAAYFIAGGLTRTMLAARVRPHRGWGWILFGGLVALLLGVLIWSQWPVSGDWAIGTLVGINLIFEGWAIFALASAARRGLSAVQDTAS